MGNKKELACPRGTKGLPPLVFDMSSIYDVEARISEVAFVTPHKAPELLARFNEAFLELTRLITATEYEQIQAKKNANRIRSIILLDKAPQILKEKGLATAKSPAGSEDLRNAVLDSDDEYQSALDRADQITAVIKLLQGKLKAFEMAYSSVKKIIGENAYNMSNPRLKATSDEPSLVEANFGNPKY